MSISPNLLKKSNKRPKSAGRPPGAANYTPDTGLAVRDMKRFPLHPDAETRAGYKWIRVYAKDREHSLLLESLANAIKAQNKNLLQYIKKL